MKNKTALYVSLGILLLVVIGGIVGIRALSKNTSTSLTEEEIQIELPPVDPSVVVDLKPKTDGKSVILTISNIPVGTTSIEYELSYNTGEGLPKGALGKVSVNGKTELERDILLGTCSTGGKCTYDTGVTAVKLVLRFNADTGATQFTKEYSLN